MSGNETGDEPTQASAQHPPTGGEGPGTARESSEDGSAGKERHEEGFDLKGIVRQLTAPMIESLDTRLRDQIEAHVEELLTAKIESAVTDRLSTVDRAIADLSRSLEDLERRLAAHDRNEGAG